MPADPSSGRRRSSRAARAAARGWSILADELEHPSSIPGGPLSTEADTVPPGDLGSTVIEGDGAFDTLRDLVRERSSAHVSEEFLDEPEPLTALDAAVLVGLAPGAPTAAEPSKPRQIVEVGRAPVAAAPQIAELEPPAPKPAPRELFDPDLVENAPAWLQLSRLAAKIIPLMIAGFIVVTILYFALPFVLDAGPKRSAVQIIDNGKPVDPIEESPLKLMRERTRERAEEER